jgi:myo-inositol-1(or 4)-monophosphatase
MVAVGNLATGPGSEARNRTRLAAIGAIADQVQRVRMLGSAAIDLAWLAAGRIDAVVVHSNKPWDLAAAVVIARSAGAITTAHDGSPFTTRSPNLLAASPGVHRALVGLVAGASPVSGHDASPAGEVRLK